MYHHVCELMKDEKLEIKWMSSVSMLVDSLTKALPAITFKSYQKNRA